MVYEGSLRAKFAAMSIRVEPSLSPPDKTTETLIPPLVSRGRRGLGGRNFKHGLPLPLSLSLLVYYGGWVALPRQRVNEVGEGEGGVLQAISARPSSPSYH